jgi:hypothetical protein
MRGASHAPRSGTKGDWLARVRPSHPTQILSLTAFPFHPLPSPPPAARHAMPSTTRCLMEGEQVVQACQPRPHTGHRVLAPLRRTNAPMCTPPRKDELARACAMEGGREERRCQDAGARIEHLCAPPAATPSGPLPSFPPFPLRPTPFSSQRPAPNLTHTPRSSNRHISKLQGGERPVCDGESPGDKPCAPSFRRHSPPVTTASPMPRSPLSRLAPSSILVAHHRVLQSQLLLTIAIPSPAGAPQDPGRDEEARRHPPRWPVSREGKEPQPQPEPRA